MKTPTTEHLSEAPLISAKKLTKRYGDLVAVDSVSFDILRGECFGFLGPNGAGKTSTMRMISCLSPVTQGSLSVDGKDPSRDQRAIKSVLGVVSQADSLDPDLTAIQNLVAHARYFNLPRRTANARIWEALDLFQLGSKARNKPDELSGGMRRRLLIARALLHRPRILVLDEPTTGLDPQSRLLVWEKLTRLKSEGITILLTTHYMDEAAYLCDRLVVMDRGRILVEGPPRGLIERHAGGRVVEIHVNPDQKHQILGLLPEGEFQYEDAGDSVLVYGDDGMLAERIGSLNGYQIVRRPANLEDVFLRLTGRELREE